jgi:hypothetical protein
MQGRTSSSSLVGFHFADPIQDDLTKALERLNEADNEYAHAVERRAICTSC